MTDTERIREFLQSYAEDSDDLEESDKFLTFSGKAFINGLLNLIQQEREKAYEEAMNGIVSGKIDSNDLYKRSFEAGAKAMAEKVKSKGRLDYKGKLQDFYDLLDQALQSLLQEKGEK